MEPWSRLTARKRVRVDLLLVAACGGQIAMGGKHKRATDNGRLLSIARRGTRAGHAYVVVVLLL